jgi:hypothetical protein
MTKEEYKEQKGQSKKSPLTWLVIVDFRKRGRENPHKNVFTKKYLNGRAKAYAMSL